MKEIICIVCPRGCHLQVDEQTLHVTGNHCERGAAYGPQELRAPTRVLTSTVRLEGGKGIRRCPVKTDRPIPKQQMMEAARALIHRVLLDKEQEEAVEERRRDYKTALQELVQRQAHQELSYRMAGEEGPDHDKTFLAEVLLNGQLIGQGRGHSKKEAEQNAAAAALEKHFTGNGKF